MLISEQAGVYVNIYVFSLIDGMMVLAGFIVAFAYTSYIGMVAKLIVLIVVLCIGILGYACVEVYQRGQDKETNGSDARPTESP